jgi:hypothetical protein
VKPGSLTSLQFHSSLNKQLPLFDSLLKPLKLKNSRFSQFNLTLNTSRNASIIPTIRAQSSSVPGMRQYSFFSTFELRDGMNINELYVWVV